MYKVRVIADSVSEAGARLTTLEVTLPRIVLAEFNTHRVFSRNSGSSRAIPVDKQLEKVMSDPFIPVYFGANKKGMQADVELTGDELQAAKAEWLAARDAAVDHVKRLLKLGLHKQITNRILEPWMWQTILVTATEWENFFALRANPDAQPEIRIAAEMMQKAMAQSTPKLLREGEWHLPLIGYTPPREDFVSDQEYSEHLLLAQEELKWAAENPEDAIKVSVGRCARVSYLTHDGVRDFEKDIELFTRLVSSGHMSPTEHVAMPHHQKVTSSDFGDVFPLQPLWSGNFHGWKQFRKTLPNEDNFAKVALAA